MSVYRLVPDFPDYRVGDDGTVWTQKSPSGQGAKIPWRLMKPWPNKHGYLCVTITNGIRRMAARVHALVLLAFVGPRPDGMESLHGPTGQKDNCLENLKYGTRKDNAADTLRDGTRLMGEKHPMHKLTRENVESIRKPLTRSRTQRWLADHFNVSFSTIRAIRCHRLWRDRPQTQEASYGEDQARTLGGT